MIAVIGGGPAGMMAAYTASKQGKEVVLFEKNEKVGRKLYISGKGRCNVTNDCTPEEFMQNIVSNPKFLYGAIKSFPPEKTMEFFEERGLSLKIERGRRVFPYSDKASDIIDALYDSLKDNNVKIKLSEKVISVKCKDENEVLITTNIGAYCFSSVIIATGGLSYSKTGSDGDGYVFAKYLGHSIVEQKPALCPIVLSYTIGTNKQKFDQNKLPLPQGLSLKNVQISVINKDNNKIIASEFGEMLFTDEGISGPCALSISSRINRMSFDNVYLSIDLKPAIDEQTLDKRILRDFEQFCNKAFKNSLGELLPKSMIPFVIELSNINPEKHVNIISKVERSNLVKLLKDMRFCIKSLGSIEESIVTSGGVSVKEISPSTMQSKLCKNVYFAGELIDVDALTGGYNIQIALATGYIAGKNAQ